MPSFLDAILPGLVGASQPLADRATTQFIEQLRQAASEREFGQRRQLEGERFERQKALELLLQEMATKREVGKEKRTETADANKQLQEALGILQAIAPQEAAGVGEMSIPPENTRSLAAELAMRAQMLSPEEGRKAEESQALIEQRRASAGASKALAQDRLSGDEGRRRSTTIIERGGELVLIDSETGDEIRNLGQATRPGTVTPAKPERPGTSQIPTERRDVLEDLVNDKLITSIATRLNRDKQQLFQEASLAVRTGQASSIREFLLQRGLVTGDDLVRAQTEAEAEFRGVQDFASSADEDQALLNAINEQINRLSGLLERGGQ